MKGNSREAASERRAETKHERTTRLHGRPLNSHRRRPPASVSAERADDRWSSSRSLTALPWQRLQGPDRSSQARADPSRCGPSACVRGSARSCATLLVPVDWARCAENLPTERSPDAGTEGPRKSSTSLVSILVMPSRHAASRTPSIVPRFGSTSSAPNARCSEDVCHKTLHDRSLAVVRVRVARMVGTRRKREASAAASFHHDLEHLQSFRPRSRTAGARNLASRMHG